MTDDVIFSSTSDLWATPDALFATVERRFGPFDLDVAADVLNTRAPAWFGPGGLNENGLAAPWLAKNVWMNPPFSREKKMPIGPWIEKAWREVESGRAGQVVALIPAKTDTKHWHEFVMPHASIVAFIEGRVKFVGATKSGKPTGATFPSAIVVWWHNSSIHVGPPTFMAWPRA